MRLKYLLGCVVAIILLSGCFKKDVCNEVKPDAIPTEELNNLRAFVTAKDPEAVYDERGFYYRIIKVGSPNKPGICSDIYANFECTDEFDNVIYQSGNNNSLMAFDLSDQLYGWRYAFPMIGMGGEMYVYFPPTLLKGYNRKKAEVHGSIPANENLAYKLSLVRYN